MVSMLLLLFSLIIQQLFAFISVAGDASVNKQQQPPSINNPLIYAAGFGELDWSTTNTAKQVWNEEEEQYRSVKYLGTWQPINGGGILLADGNSHYAFSAGLKRGGPVSISQGKVTDPLIFSYEVRDAEGAWNCGGAYAKFLTPHTEGGQWWPERFNDQSAYAVMFGPDRCGGEVDKVHFIFAAKKATYHRLKNPPKTKHTTLTTLYALYLWPDDRFEIRIDGETVRSGSLASPDDFEPPFHEPPTIDDPADKKPGDWVDQAEIPDPTAIRPADWPTDAQLAEMPMLIADPDAKKPIGWLDHVDPFIPDPSAGPDAMIENPLCLEAPGCGTWEAPLIPNPAYPGTWRPPMIPNPHYRGPWRAKQIPNPAYNGPSDSLVVEAIPSFAAVGFEVWRVEGGLLLDNLFIGRDWNAYREFVQSTWNPKHDVEMEIYKAQLVENTNSQPTYEQPSIKVHGSGINWAFERLQEHINEFVAVSKSRHPLEAIQLYPFIALNLTLISLAIAILLAKLIMSWQPDRKAKSAKEAGLSEEEEGSQHLTVLKTAVLLDDCSGEQDDEGKDEKAQAKSSQPSKLSSLRPSRLSSRTASLSKSKIAEETTIFE